MITRVKGSSFNVLDIEGAVSLLDLGPVNTDITTALQAILTAGTPVIVPVGTWRFSTLTLPAGTIMYGLGPKSILKANDLANAINLTVGSNSVLQNFVIDGNKVNQVGSNFHGIDLTNAAGVRMLDVGCINHKGCSFNIAGTASEIEIVGGYASGYTDSGFKVAAGNNISFIACRVASSDAAATGDAFAIASNGAAISGIIIDDAVVQTITGRGIALIGNGSKNVTDVSITNSRIQAPSSHGIHMINVDSANVIGGVTKAASGDGVRLEGDVQNCRIVTHISKSNVGFGMREIVSGSTPNFNGLIYSTLAGNGNNTITKVGASSYIV